MSDIFEEARQDLREENIIKLWRAYGNYAIAGVLVVLIGALGSVGWDFLEEKRQKRQGDAFVAALKSLKSGQREPALTSLAALGQESGQGYALLAKLKRASLLAGETPKKPSQRQSSDFSDASKNFYAIAQDSSVEENYRHLSLLVAAALDLESEQNNPRLFKEVEALSKGRSPWRALALELMALSHIKEGHRELALKLFKEIEGDDTSPQAVKARAHSLAMTMKSLLKSAPPLEP